MIMNARISFFACALVLFVGSSNTYMVRVFNNTPEKITVQALVIGPSSQDQSREIEAGDDVGIELPGAYCLSRIRVNGNFPENNWPAIAKCWNTSCEVTKLPDGRYSLVNKGDNSGVWNTRIVNETDDTLQVQVLTVGPEGADKTYTLAPHEDKRVTIPDSWCFSRLKVNGQFPADNWPVGAKCMYTASVISGGNGSYRLTRRLTGPAADFLLNLKRSVSSAAAQLESTAGTITEKLAPLFAISKQASDNKLKVEALIKDAEKQLKTVQDAHAQVQKLNLNANGFPELGASIDTMIQSIEHVISTLTGPQGTCAAKPGMLCTINATLDTLVKEADKQSASLRNGIDVMKKTIESPAKNSSTKSLNAPQRLRYIINDLL